ncbi:MAG: phosphopantothenoylcysteine decarboxylase [Planctomycetes bacterium]|nr:phosphopantothenoylcysteine decarboxylase [Planctomycetota bacterium]
MVAILITAGPTREHLDDVRYLSNGSSGRMGFALALAAATAGHQPTLVLGPTELPPPPGVAVVRVVSALEMQAAAERAFATADVAIAAAAVCDWRPARRAPGKPPKPAAGGGQTLELVANPDIVAGLAARKGRRVVVGFGLESAAAGMPAAIARGRGKLVQKGLDLVVVNLHDAIGSDEAGIVLCHADGRDEALPRGGKDLAAARIVAAAVQLWRERATT